MSCVKLSGKFTTFSTANRMNKQGMKIAFELEEFQECFLRAFKLIHATIQFPFDNIFMTLPTSRRNVQELKS